MNRLDPTDDIHPPPDIEALDQLHRSGWSIGDVAFSDGAGGLAWLVWGSIDENLIRAEGTTRDEACAGSIDQA